MVAWQGALYTAAMVLDTRLMNLAKGMSVRQAALAHAKSLDRQTPLSDDERSLADEFGAIVEIMFLMAAVDGEVADDEVRQLSTSVGAIIGEEAPDLTAELGVLADALERDGWRVRMESACQRIRSDEARKLAFRLAAGVAFVDDHIAHAEAAAIESLTSALGLDGDESQQIMREVMDELLGQT